MIDALTGCEAFDTSAARRETDLGICGKLLDLACGEIDRLRKEMGVEALGHLRAQKASADLNHQLLELLKDAVGDGPDCECGPDGHVCGWPRWAGLARVLIEKADGTSPLPRETKP